VTDRERVEHRVGGIDEFPAGTHKVVKVGRLREIGVFNIGGTLYALPNLCPHQTGPLCRGRVTGAIEAAANDRGTWDFEWVMQGEVITCPWHQLEFHVPTGRCLAFPHLKLRPYEVILDGSDVRVRI
jgi:nitrite reductase/ring-hydroxylating ferredoxin subunit